MLASLRPAFIIARREVRDQFRDWRIIFPVLGLTLFFPFLMNFTAAQALSFVERYGANIIADRLVPFLLMVVGFFPISASMVIALETFVGEKERGSIEPLLNTPLEDWQLYVGKLLSATVPPLMSSFLGMGVYLVGLSRQNIALPEPPLMLIIFALTVVQAFVMVAGAVVISSQATSVRAANLLASFIVIPIALLIQAESAVMFWGNYAILWLLVLALLVMTILLLRVGMAHFQREELLGREIDVLNFRWGWRVFWQAFRGGARTLKGWYLQVLPRTIRRLRRPSLVVLLLIILAVGLGATQLGRYPIPAQLQDVSNIARNLESLKTDYPLFSFSPVLAIWWQNVRALVVALLVGTLTFGVLGLLPAMATFGILGFILAVAESNGIPIGLYLAGFILPHGIIEIPAVVLASAAVLQLGAILATPTPGKTITEVLLTCLADWFKVMFGAVIPLLLFSAAVEAWVTPHIALWLFR